MSRSGQEGQEWVEDDYYVFIARLTFPFKKNVLKALGDIK